MEKCILEAKEATYVYNALKPLVTYLANAMQYMASEGIDYCIEDVEVRLTAEEAKNLRGAFVVFIASETRINENSKETSP